MRLVCPLVVHTLSRVMIDLTELSTYFAMNFVEVMFVGPPHSTTVGVGKDHIVVLRKLLV